MVEWLKAYPAVFEETSDGGYSVFFPDVAGCISAGHDLEEAITMAKEALSLHLSELINDNEEAPAVDLNHAKEEAEGCLLMMIEPNPAIISRRTKEHAVRVNITIPQMLLERADRYAKAANINRSRLIALALEHQLSATY
ncbi:MAG: type II toxin-antitoxin system HicB family antitoxin [Campylobacterales bacterium]|nr:type II toxin-antitoxin system HicB family antitoxin [Campylobacterales bacterium]